MSEKFESSIGGSDSGSFSEVFHRHSHGTSLGCIIPPTTTAKSNLHLSSSGTHQNTSSTTPTTLLIPTASPTVPPHPLEFNLVSASDLSPLGPNVTTAAILTDISGPCTVPAPPSPPPPPSHTNSNSQMTSMTLSEGTLNTSTSSFNTTSSTAVKVCYKCGQSGHHPAVCTAPVYYLTCALHNRTRSEKNLFFDEVAGIMRCHPSCECRPRDPNHPRTLNPTALPPPPPPPQMMTSQPQQHLNHTAPAPHQMVLQPQPLQQQQQQQFVQLAPSPFPFPTHSTTTSIINDPQQYQQYAYITQQQPIVFAAAPVPAPFPQQQQQQVMYLQTPQGLVPVMQVGGTTSQLHPQHQPAPLYFYA